MSRYRLSDVVHPPEPTRFAPTVPPFRDRLFCWWEDLPWRRRSWWHEALFAPGEGWLRWRSDYRERISYEPPDIDQWWVFPPLHRYWLAATGWMAHPILVLRGDLRWREFPVWSDVSCLKSADRRELFR